MTFTKVVIEGADSLKDRALHQSLALDKREEEIGIPGWHRGEKTQAPAQTELSRVGVCLRVSIAVMNR